LCWYAFAVTISTLALSFGSVLCPAAGVSAKG